VKAGPKPRQCNKTSKRLYLLSLSKRMNNEHRTMEKTILVMINLEKNNNIYDFAKLKQHGLPSIPK